MRVAKRMRSIPPSSTLRVLSLAKRLEREGRRIIHLEVGEPDFDTPEHVKRAAVEALAKGMTKYTPSEGIPELRQVIADRAGEGIEKENVLITPGAKHAIFCAMIAVLDPGDEVIVPSPCWTYDGIILTAGGKPVFVKTEMEEEFKIKSEKVQDVITRKTKMLLINYPNNPTGATIDKDELRALVELASDHDLWIMSDEIYDRLTYEKEHVSILDLSGDMERTIYINGFSKTYAMTGWRLGYAIAPKELVAQMNKVQQASTSCVPGFVQAAGLAALEGPQDCVEKMREEFLKRRDLIVNGLNSLDLKCFNPRGAFYVFPNIEVSGMNSVKFCETLLEKAGVAAVPGTGFGPFGEGHVRLSFANTLESLSEAIECIRSILSE